MKKKISNGIVIKDLCHFRREDGERMSFHLRNLDEEKERFLFRIRHPYLGSGFNAII